MSEAVNLGYEISRKDAGELAAISLMPVEERRELLRRFAASRGPDALLELFAQFIGLSNSVVANTREFIELYLICECQHYPETAAKINLPTILGALQGIRVAICPVRGMCGGCAYRQGTAANQSPITSLDAEWTIENDRELFHRHESLDEDGQPTRVCAGYAMAHKAIWQEPAPERREVRRGMEE